MSADAMTTFHLPDAAKRWAPLMIALVLAAAIRLAAINFSLWYDETAAITFARQPLSLLWSNWAARETNPPLYYSLLHVWIWLFGESDIAVKALPFVIGMASIALLYRAAVLLTGSHLVAFIAALMTAVIEPHVHYSLESRGYIMAYTGALVAISAIVDIWRRYQAELRPDCRWPLVQYVLGSTIAVYSHTTLILYVAVANIVVAVLILSRWRGLSRLIPGWILANVMLAVIWAWWGWITVHQANGHNANIKWLAPPTASDGVEAWREVFAPFRSHALPLLPELLLMVIFAHAAWRGRYRSAALFMLGCSIVLPMVMFLISLKVPVYVPKTLFAASSLFTLALAAAVAGLGLWPRLVVMFLLSSGAVLQLAHELPRRERDRWDMAAVRLLAHRPLVPLFVADEGVAIAVDHYCRRVVQGPCPLDIRIVGAPADWSYGLSGYSRIGAAEARAIAARGDYTTIIWSQPRDQLNYLAPQSRMTRQVTKLGSLGELTYWHHEP